MSLAELHVGYAGRVITPSLDMPAYLAGFGRNRVAQSFHDDLYARALALVHGETRIVLVALDLIGLGRAHCQEIESRVRAQHPGIQLIIACTHVHHGPDTIGLWGPDLTTSGVNIDYLNGVKAAVERVSLEALAQVQAARVRSTSVIVTGVAKNARDPEIRDEELNCIQFVAADGGLPLATWLIFPCHPEVLWDGNTAITSDYVHSLRAKVETMTGAPALFMAGALGGMMTPDVVQHDFDESELMGLRLADAALQSLAGVEAHPVGELIYHRQIFSIPLQSFLFEQAAEAGLLPEVRDASGNITTEAGLLKIGKLWFAAVPGELLPRLGLLLKAEMRAAGAGLAVVMGLANDEIGYILPQEDYIYPENPFEPGDHYEETMSIGPETAPRLLAALRGLWG